MGSQETLNPYKSILEYGELSGLNARIQDALLNYLPEEVTIRFDMPKRTEEPSQPTLCVFLYDVQEDLSLRQVQGGQYSPVLGRYEDRQVNLRCSYLVTFWETMTNEASSYADNDSVRVINSTLSALLTMQFPPEYPSYLRIVPPAEHLSSLGNLWQSISDRPRLCLNFSVTIPFMATSLNCPDNYVSSVQTTRLDSDLWQSEDLALRFKRELVTDVIAKWKMKETPMEDVRAQLTRLQVVCRDEYSATINGPQPVMYLEGTLSEPLSDSVTEVCDKMLKYDTWKRRSLTIRKTIEVMPDMKREVVDAATPGDPAA